MAEFIFEIIKKGNEGGIISEVVSLSGIKFDENDKIVYLPSEYNGMPVTYFGYKQGVREPQPKFHDWHHPGQGYSDEMTPREFIEDDCDYFNIPDNVEKIIFPKTVYSINTYRFNGFSHKVIFELHPEIKNYVINCYGSINSK